MAAGAVYEWIEVEGRRCGFLAYRGEPGGIRMRLSKLYLLPECHGRGFGALALARVKAAARERGFREVGLYVFKRNAKAIRAYTRAGFVVERAASFEAGEGFQYDDYIMVCRLGTGQGTDAAPCPEADF
jgi:ribosomal protein S18 acetylase RimI-like enzyme